MQYLINIQEARSKVSQLGQDLIGIIFMPTPNREFNPSGFQYLEGG